MSTHILSFILTKKFRSGAVLEQLKEGFEELKSFCRKKRRNLGYKGEINAVIQRAAKILGSQLITVSYSNDSPFYKAVTESPGLVQLGYYANNVTPLYIDQALFGE